MWQALLKLKEILFSYRGGKFISVGEKIRLPDDVTMGYIIGMRFFFLALGVNVESLNFVWGFNNVVQSAFCLAALTTAIHGTFPFTQFHFFFFFSEHLLRKPLTVVDHFHSHLEPMKFLNRNTLKDQVIIVFLELRYFGTYLRVFIVNEWKYLYYCP